MFFKKTIDSRILLYCNNLCLLLPIYKITYGNLKNVVEELRSKTVLTHADKTAYNVVVV